MRPIGDLALLLLPVVLAGACNMVFVKLRWTESLRKPMDGGLVMPDGKRLFGDHKTWGGFAGMVVFTAFWVSVVETAGAVWPALGTAFPVPLAGQPGGYSGAVVGAVLGLAYVLAELPNSFIKRRIDIAPGKNGAGPIGLAFLVLDQADSVIGCALVLPWLCDLRLADYVVLVLLGTVVHYVTNVTLYLLKLRKQPA